MAPAFFLHLLFKEESGKVFAFRCEAAEEWLTASEAAAHLKVKPRTILQWAKDGKIHGHVLSGTKRCTWRFLRSELDAILTTPSAALVNGRIQ
jgi:excisionase family DNA binding protein